MTSFHLCNKCRAPCQNYGGDERVTQCSQFVGRYPCDGQDERAGPWCRECGTEECYTAKVYYRRNAAFAWD